MSKNMEERKKEWREGKENGVRENGKQKRREIQVREEKWKGYGEKMESKYKIMEILDWEKKTETE